MTIQRSVGAGGANQFNDVQLVQQLLNSQQGTNYARAAIAVDGQVGPLTIDAIRHYQSTVVGLNNPDGRVDCNGRTITALLQHAGADQGAPLAPAPQPTPSAPAGDFRITYRHGGVVPGAAQYESQVMVAGPTSEVFSGSIYPDDMNVKGRVVDGTYDLNLCFHHKVGTPELSDLIVKFEGNLRPALTVNRGNTLPVTSNNPSKTTSSAINLHNGFYGNRGSDGCLTIKKDHWTRFISIFLDLYPSLADWNENGSLIGRKIGSVTICR